MRRYPTYAKKCFITLGAVAFMSAAVCQQLAAAELAADSLSVSQVSPGTNQYKLTLNDTSTTTIGTFWFAWVPGDNFMPVSPTSITSPTGWVEKVTSGGPSGGYAVQWKASNSSSEINPGSSLTGFSFDSTLSLAQLEAPSAGTPNDPVFTAFVYSGAPFSDSGFQLTPSISSASAPEPAVTGSIALGLALLIFVLRRKSSLSTNEK